MTKVRAKVLITGNKEGAIEAQAVIEGSAENKSFFEFTPALSLKMAVVSEGTAAFFEVGKEYYLDFTKAP